jgi:hypothetical protein
MCVCLFFNPYHIFDSKKTKKYNDNKKRDIKIYNNALDQVIPFNVMVRCTKING